MFWNSKFAFYKTQICFLQTQIWPKISKISKHKFLYWKHKFQKRKYEFKITRICFLKRKYENNFVIVAYKSGFVFYKMDLLFKTQINSDLKHKFYFQNTNFKKQIWVGFTFVYQKQIRFYRKQIRVYKYEFAFL